LNFFYIKLNNLIWYNSGNESGPIVYIIITAAHCFRCLFYFFTVGHVNAETSQGAKRIRIDAPACTCISAYILYTYTYIYTTVSPNRLSFVIHSFYRVHTRLHFGKYTLFSFDSDNCILKYWNMILEQSRFGRCWVKNKSIPIALFINLEYA